MDLEFYVRVRTCEKRVTGKQPLLKSTDTTRKKSTSASSKL